MKRALAFLAAAVAVIAGGAWLFSAIEHLPFGDGFYWAVETGTTVGYGDVTPHNGAGRVVAVVVMLLAIPLFGAVFALLTAAHVHKRVHASVSERLAEAEKRIAEDAEHRHEAMKRLFAAHCADIKKHVSVVADAQASAGAGSNPAEAGLDADQSQADPPPVGERAVPPDAASPVVGVTEASPRPASRKLQRPRGM
jgi:Ion channel